MTLRLNKWFLPIIRSSASYNFNVANGPGVTSLTSTEILFNVQFTTLI